MSAFNMILLSLDLLVAVFAPTSYNRHVTLRLTLSYTISWLLSLAFSLPNCFLVQNVYFGCQTKQWDFHLPIFNRIFPYLWTLSTFLAPLVIVVTVYVAIFMRLHHRILFAPVGSKKSIPKRVSRRFTMTIFVFAIVNIVCVAPDNIYGILANTLRLQDSQGNPWHMCTTFLVTLNCCSTPWVLLLLQPQIKKRLLDLINQWLKRKTTDTSDASMMYSSRTNKPGHGDNG
ncbi:hypothetical protein FBUS_02432 [Fasciolopsis buskii]|uniref:G-protein coupled receptors family 1 profile domain-containing protein n=1 Tax=Fasciolopsis buskii TaxID=27845 RepID=A0A8E0VLD2_9TREM|nr:hypothetical protein FBUS_02432 [Fasciolopsis buski]